MRLNWTYLSFFRFYDKTVNHWEDRENFVKHAGKYDMLLMDYEAKVCYT